MEHVLYTPEDFTDEEYQQGDQLAKLVVDGGLGICKICGKAEVELEGPCKARDGHNPKCPHRGE